MKLEEIIEKRLDVYYRLCESVILVIYFDDDDGPITFTDEDKITTNLAIKATSESLEEDIFNFKNEKYAWVWYEDITLDEWGNYERYATFPQDGWELFNSD